MLISHKKNECCSLHLVTSQEQLSLVHSKLGLKYEYPYIISQSVQSHVENNLQTALYRDHILTTTKQQQQQNDWYTLHFVNSINCFFPHLFIFWQFCCCNSSWCCKFGCELLLIFLRSFYCIFDLLNTITYFFLRRPGFIHVTTTTKYGMPAFFNCFFFINRQLKCIAM